MDVYRGESAGSEENGRIIRLVIAMAAPVAKKPVGNLTIQTALLLRIGEVVQRCGLSARGIRGLVPHAIRQSVEPSFNPSRGYAAVRDAR